MIPARGPQTLKCKAVHGHESNITWSPRARQEDRGTGAHNMGTCPLARLSLLSMLNHGFVIELAIRFCFLYRFHYNTHDRIYYRTHDRIHCLGSTLVFTANLVTQPVMQPS